MNTSYLNAYFYEGKLTMRKTKQLSFVVLYAGFKYLFDRIVALLGLIILLPLILIIAIAIKLDSKGPVFFKQKRTGKDGKAFEVYKFRTMTADNDVHDFSKKDQHTRVGKFLRKTSLDEIPQLINVFCY